VPNRLYVKSLDVAHASVATAGSVLSRVRQRILSRAPGFAGRRQACTGTGAVSDSSLGGRGGSGFRKWWSPRG
jgi:hypothetical protein